MINKTVIVTGPTATGKTFLATQLCRIFNGELISADSRQVYKGLNIGTGKDLEDYLEPSKVKYHMIDICEPNEDFSLFDWRQKYIEYHRLIRQKDSLPIVCGGTPLYVDMMLNDYQLKGDKRTYTNAELEDLSLEKLVEELRENYPHMISSTDITQKARVMRALEIAQAKVKNLKALPETDYLIIAPYWHRKVVHERIEERLDKRWLGLQKEAMNLLDSGVSHERMEWFGLEYRYMSRLLTDQLTQEEAFEQLLTRIRQFVKRQDIWFRKIENAGHVIHWLTEDDKLSEAKELIELFLNDKKLPEPKFRISKLTYGPRTQ